jgi:outer membrane protein assembly factor BamB
MIRVLVILGVLLSLTVRAGSRSWPEFRGASGQGIAESAALPLRWSETNNVRWKTPIHGRAWSSPVVDEQRIWVTTASEDGQQLGVISVELATGKILHDQKLFDVPNPQFAHKFNTYGSPTPVLEGNRVYVTFGSPGTACLDAETGRVLWQRTDFVCNHFRGAGSSPVLYKNLLLMNYDGSDFQFVVALDKETGKTVWKKDRSIDFKDLTAEGKPEADGDFRKAFSTPLVTDYGSGPVLLSLGSKALYAYRPETGEELWRVEERKCHSGTCRPVVGEGLIFSSMGFAKSELLAIKPNGANPEIVWRTGRNAPCKPSPLLVNGLLFTVDDGGIASCLDAKTGREIWRERIGGNYSASPIAGAGRIYCFNEEGKTVIIEAGPEFKKLAANDLGDGFMASPAVAGNALILRSRTHLYRVQE